MTDLLLSYLIKFSGKKIIFPFYHIVSDEDCPHVKHLYPIKSVHKFEEELDFLQKHFQPISLEELLQHIQNKTQPHKPSFFLSFDDGLRECSTVIAPILKKRGIPAAFFLNSDFVGNQDLFYRYKVSLIWDKISTEKLDYPISKKELLEFKYADSDKIDQIANEIHLDFGEFLLNSKPYMNWGEIKDMQKDGFYFGGHSIDHPLYKLIPLEEQIRQTQSSVERVVDELNLDYQLFAFPFTDDKVSSEFFETIYEENIVNLSFGTAGIKSDQFEKNIQRLNMEKSLDSPERYIFINFVSYYVKKILGKSRVQHSNS
jgi:hypothetical protein